MRRIFFALLLAIFAITPASAANFYWKASTTDLNAIAAPSAGDRGIVITDAGVVSYWTYSGSAWVQAFADLPALGPIFAAATSKTTPVDADEIPLSNSQSSGALNALSWANLKATLSSLYVAAFDLTGNGGKMVVVNSGGTALETTATLTNIKIPVAYDSVPIGNATSDDMVDTAMAEETVLGRRTGGHLGAIAIGSSAGQIATGDHTHSGTYESALGNPDADGKVLASTADGVRSWVTAGTGSGVTEVIAASSATLSTANVNNTIINNYGQTVANTQTLPTCAAAYNGMVVIGTAGMGAFSLKAGPNDKIYLDGVALDDGDKVTLATPAVGDYFSFWAFKTGASSWDWRVVSGVGLLTDGGA